MSKRKTKDKSSINANLFFALLTNFFIQSYSFAKFKFTEANYFSSSCRSSSVAL